MKDRHEHGDEITVSGWKRNRWAWGQNVKKENKEERKYNRRNKGNTEWKLKGGGMGRK